MVSRDGFDRWFKEVDPPLNFERVPGSIRAAMSLPMAISYRITPSGEHVETMKDKEDEGIENRSPSSRAFDFPPVPVHARRAKRVWPVFDSFSGLQIIRNSIYRYVCMYGHI